MAWSKAKRMSNDSFNNIHHESAAPGVGLYHLDGHKSITKKARGGLFGVGMPKLPPRIGYNMRPRLSLGLEDKCPQTGRNPTFTGSPGPARYHMSKKLGDSAPKFTIRPRTAPLNCRGDPNPESPPASKYYIGISPGSESPMAKISPCGPCRKGLEHNCWMTEGPGPAGLNISDLTKTLSPKSSTSALSMRRKLHSAPRSRRAGGNVEWPGADTPGPGEYHTQKLQDRF